MDKCFAFREDNVKCGNFVTDEGSCYCIEHIHRQELLQQKWDRRDEQLRKGVKKYREVDPLRYKRQVQKAKKKYKESGKAKEYEQSAAGKLRKQRYRQKKRYEKECGTQLERLASPHYEDNECYAVGDFVVISGIEKRKGNYWRHFGESIRLNGFKGIIMEALDYDTYEYWIDIGEENEVNVQSCHVHKCDVPQSVRNKVWANLGTFYIRRENAKVKFMRNNMNNSMEPPKKKQKAKCNVCSNQQITHGFQCGHSFCEPCIDEILNTTKQCAICKSKVQMVFQR